MFTVYIVNNFIYFVKGFDVKNKYFYLPFVRVHICTVSDTLQRLGVGLPWYLFALVFWHGLPCFLCCAVCPGALELGSLPAGYIAAAQPHPVSPVTTEKIKKAQK